MEPTSTLPTFRVNYPWEIYFGVSIGCLMASWIAVASYGWGLFAWPVLVLIALAPCVLIYLVRLFVKKASQSREPSRKEKFRVLKIFLLIVWPTCALLPILCYWVPLRVQLWSVPEYDEWAKTKSEVVLFGYDDGRSCSVTMMGYSNPKMVFRYYEEWLESNGYDRIPPLYPQVDNRRSSEYGGVQYMVRRYSKKGTGGATLSLKYPLVPYTGNREVIDTQRKSELLIIFTKR